MSLKISWKSTDAKKGASGGAPDGGGRLWGGSGDGLARATASAYAQRRDCFLIYLLKKKFRTFGDRANNAENLI